MSDYDIEKILDLPLSPCSVVSTTIRGYLGEILFKFWTSPEEFDPIRPFGYKEWEYDLHYPLVKAGLVQGSWTHFGALDVYDVHACNVIITRCITQMRESP